jgi:hypothetical protein
MGVLESGYGVLKVVAVGVGRASVFELSDGLAEVGLSVGGGKRDLKLFVSMFFKLKKKKNSGDGCHQGV